MESTYYVTYQITLEICVENAQSIQEAIKDVLEMDEADRFGLARSIDSEIISVTKN